MSPDSKTFYFTCSATITRLPYILLIRVTTTNNRDGVGKISECDRGKKGIKERHKEASDKNMNKIHFPLKFQATLFYTAYK